MPLRSHDFECLDCGEIFTDLVKFALGDFTSCGDAVCECGSTNLVKLITETNLGTFSMASPEQQRAMMKKRSADHTQKEIINKEPERYDVPGNRRSTPKIQTGYKGKPKVNRKTK